MSAKPGSITVSEPRPGRFPAGLRCASPLLLFMALGFLAPLLTVAGYAFARPKTFNLFAGFTVSLQNFGALFGAEKTVWLSFAWSLGLALACVAVLLVVSYPVACGLARLFGKFAGFISVLFVFPLFVSENVRLYGWTQFFMRNGVLDGVLRRLLGAADSVLPDMLYTPWMTLFGMVYVYLPFMLFPLTLGISMVPRDLVDAAKDLGAPRLMIWREIELPLALPGLLVGVLLTFVLGSGAIVEAKILGGQSVITIAQDIETAFTYAQNWPLGSALAVLLVVIVGALALTVLSKLDIDRVLGRR